VVGEASTFPVGSVTAFAPSTVQGGQSTIGRFGFYLVHGPHGFYAVSMTAQGAANGGRVMSRLIPRTSRSPVRTVPSGIDSCTRPHDPPPTTRSTGTGCSSRPPRSRGTVTCWSMRGTALNRRPKRGGKAPAR
jgi:hypothetical protein